MRPKELYRLFILAMCFQLFFQSIIRRKLLGRVREVIQEKQFRTSVRLKKPDRTIYTLFIVFKGYIMVLLLNNSSLKFEIKAKQFYAASQRVL